jgi:hypothetical protein
VNRGVVGAELSAELLQIKADMVLVELTDDEVHSYVLGLVTMNIHKAHVFFEVFFSYGDAIALGFSFFFQKTWVWCGLCYCGIYTGGADGGVQSEVPGVGGL